MKKLIKLKKGEDKRIVSGHLWVFSNEVQEIQGEPQAGDVVELRKYSGEYIGKGFYNPNSLIAFRLLTTDDEDIDFQFYKSRIEKSLALRRKLFEKAESFRLVHGEGDFLPGLIIDKYNDYFSIQTFSFGMDKHITLICDVLDSLFKPAGIIRRDESPLRSLEGLSEIKEVVRGKVDSTIITENEIKYQIDIHQGQKTGFFLDQRENRLSIRRYVKDAKVLDCFCNDGGFALNAGYGGATNVRGIDISESAVNRGEYNAEMNQLADRVKFLQGNVFDFLKNHTENFDVIILDPPSFTKSRKNIPTAKIGYKEVNTNALKLLNSGGILATASCSHHINDELFLEIVNSSAKQASRRIRLLEWRSASPDHPVLPSMPETKYLKFGIFEVY